MIPLTPALRRELRAKAHHLDPVVIVGQHGLTPAVLKEIDVNLLAHQLIKVRVFTDERGAREAMLERICTALDASPVQHIGKLLVVWRRSPEPSAEKPAARPAGTRARTKPGASVKEKTMAKSAPQARRPRSPLARTTARPAAPRSTGGAAGRTPSAQARRRRGQGK